MDYLGKKKDVIMFSCYTFVSFKQKFVRKLYSDVTRNW